MGRNSPHKYRNNPNTLFLKNRNSPLFNNFYPENSTFGTCGVVHKPFFWNGPKCVLCLHYESQKTQTDGQQNLTFVRKRSMLCVAVRRSFFTAQTYTAKQDALLHFLLIPF